MKTNHSQRGLEARILEANVSEKQPQRRMQTNQFSGARTAQGIDIRPWSAKKILLLPHCFLCSFSITQ